jgi:uncharacterized protein (TIGR02599 family)
LLAVAISQTGKAFTSTRAKVDQFREGRAAFERVTLKLSQATLNTYWDYDKPLVYTANVTDVNATKYIRNSELRFFSGLADKGNLLPTINGRKRITHCTFFFAPGGYVAGVSSPLRGLENLLNTWGYFLEFGNERDLRPGFLSSERVGLPEKWRFRLMEFSEPAHLTRVYDMTSGLTGGNGFKNTGYTGKEWFTASLSVDNPAATRRIADNIVALILTPRLPAEEEEQWRKAKGQPSLTFSPLAPKYEYDSSVQGREAGIDSKNQLPGMVEVTMVVIDERSANKLELTSADADIFKVSGKFTDTLKFDDDLRLSSNSESLEKVLTAKRVDYRIFNSKVAIRGAKWSRQDVIPTP